MMHKYIYLEVNACMTSTGSVQPSFLMSFDLIERNLWYFSTLAFLQVAISQGFLEEESSGHKISPVDWFLLVTFFVVTYD